MEKIPNIKKDITIIDMNMLTTGIKVKILPKWSASLLSIYSPIVSPLSMSI
jgi:hypothetical protein